MKREVLFRGQRVDNGEWVYGDLIQNPESEYPEIGFMSNYGGDGISEPPYSYYILVKVIPETVGQFTGLTDKNGKMIFEGDFIDGFEYPVTYEDGGFCATIQYQLVRCWLNSDNCNLENLDVIGNIHDNPELLNK